MLKISAKNKLIQTVLRLWLLRLCVSEDPGDCFNKHNGPSDPATDQSAM